MSMSIRSPELRKGRRVRFAWNPTGNYGTVIAHRRGKVIVDWRFEGSGAMEPRMLIPDWRQ